MARLSRSSLSLALLVALAGCGGTDSPTKNTSQTGQSSSSSSGALTSSSSSSSSSSTSSSSSSSSSSSGSTFTGNAARGEAVFESDCNTCHVDKKDGTFAKGLYAFDVNSFTYPSSTTYPGYSSETVEHLASFISDNMALETCDAACVDDLAAYLWSYKNENTPVTVKPVEFDDEGLKLELICSDDQSDLNVKITNPDGQTDSPPASYFTPVRSTPAGVSMPEMSSVVKLADNDLLVLEGDGEDIWDKAIYFSGLTTGVVDGQLDMTLTVEQVTNIKHDFAKVGILASSTDDLSGELIFLHWSGGAGIAEDSGVGALDNYSLLIENPIKGIRTPTPTTLRLAYQDEQLRIGGCYGCSAPAMQDAVKINFEPKRVFIVASSHDTSRIEAQVRVRDAFSPKISNETVYETVISCEDAVDGIQLSDVDVQGMDQLSVEVYQANALVGQQFLERQFSAATSCAAQGQLLEPKIRRLSQTQFKNVLTDIFGDLFAPEVWPDMADGARLIGMNTMADKLNINSINFERLLKSSRSIVQTLLNKHAAIKKCSQSSSDVCLTDLALEYGPKLWRRPLSDDELAGLYIGIESSGSNAQALEFMFNSFILSSNFLFRTELGQEADGIAQLNNYEIVSLLSFTVWNSAPDQALLDLAAKSSPITEAELKAQIDRMFADPRADKALMEVYKDYLKLDLVLTRDKADEFKFSDNVRRDLLASAEKMLLDNINADTHFLDVFGGTSFYVNDTIAPFFNASSTSTKLEPVEFSSSERNGLLNHPAFLSVHSTLTQSGIVQRGVFALEQLLCQEIPDPPGDVMSVPVPNDVDPDAISERELLQITHSTQAACVGCHRFIDPAGFGFENFDAVGRHRTSEKGGVVIDASGVLEGLGEHVLSYNTSAEYASALTESPQMNHCVSQRFLEHYLSQELTHNACELKKYQSILSKSEESVKDLLYALVSLESFGKRKLTQ